MNEGKLEYIKIIIIHLTTALPVGGWAPGVSRGFTFWQSAPSLNNASMATTIEQPSQEIPQKKEVKQAGTHHTEKYQ